MMARPKRIFNIGVFGIPAKLVLGDVRIKVNVRTDQDYQWKAAKLDPIPGVQLVDCPGGAVGPEDVTSLEDALKREIAEETGGCQIRITGPFSEPFVYMNPDPDKPCDIAVWAPIILLGEPKPSNEALDHLWISLDEFNAEKPYRCVSGLGNKGRTGRMMATALSYYQSFRHLPIFS